jgi:Coenzyme PQQ synthesis protein D (PqqD)
VEWVEVDGEAVLYDPTQHTLHRLNRGAAAVRAACDGTVSSEQITHGIEGAYSSPRRAIARDVPDVIARFRRLSLLRRSQGDADADR